MSRIGRMPVPVPPGLAVTIKDNEVIVKGPKGELKRRFDPAMSISLQDNNLIVTRPSDSKIHRSLHGLTRSLLANMVTGVTEGFKKELEIVGVGYRAEKAANKLVLRVGLSHLVEFAPPAGIALDVEGANRIRVSGADKEMVGEIAAKIRSSRLPDAYKGKGIKYAGEVVHLKPGKAGKVIGRK